jgi:lactate racemase
MSSVSEMVATRSSSGRSSLRERAGGDTAQCTDMNVSVSYHDERLGFEVPDERVVAAWNAPTGLDGPREAAAIRDALEQPWDFPPLRQMIVPGDRVTIAFDPTIARPQPILEVLGQTLRESGVEPDGLTVLSSSAARSHLEQALPTGATLVVHDPAERTHLAYLAATKEGRRIYLNRALTDADVVVPVGRLGFDPIMGYRGPWSVIFPDLSERATIDAHRGRVRDLAVEPVAARASASLDESFEVSWLLGCQFHVGVVPGSSGLVTVVAGQVNAVRERGIASVDSSWTLEADSRAELVVAGIGGPGLPATIDDLAAGLATACRLVQHGGKIVVLSRVQGAVGPAMRSLIDADDPQKRAAALRGHEGDDDYLAARKVAQALAWADVFVLSELGPELVEDLSLIALEHPEQARRLVAKSGSCSFVSQAELTRASVLEDVEK